MCIDWFEHVLLLLPSDVYLPAQCDDECTYLWRNDQQGEGRQPCRWGQNKRNAEA